MRIGFTGPREVPPEAIAPALEYVDRETVDGHEFTSGACRGWDAIVANHLLDTRPDAVHRLVVPANLSQVDWAIIERFRYLNAVEPDRFILEFMPAGTTYKQRNQRIVDSYSERLVPVCAYPEGHGKSRRSGSWQTVRLGRAAEVDVRDPFILSEIPVPA